MPPKVGSRHTFTRVRSGSDGKRYLTEREPYLYRDLSDNRYHIVRQGDTWFTIAARAFAGLPRGCGFWWAIADFQPQPIVDPTVQPDPGSVVVIPSITTLTNRILSEDRRKEHG
jgi:hypothetical protein